MNEQAVNTTPDADPSQELVDANVAQEQDLDSLLAEYNPPETPAETPKEAPSTDEMTEMRNMLAEARAEKVNAGLTEAAMLIKKAAGESAANIPDKLFKGALREEAVLNPKIEQMFNNRHADPASWNKVVTALGKKIGEDLTPVDSASTESWNAVEGAVHSSQTHSPKQASVPTEKELRNMSTAEFESLRKKMGFKR